LKLSDFFVLGISVSPNILLQSHGTLEAAVGHTLQVHILWLTCHASEAVVCPYVSVSVYVFAKFLKTRKCGN